MFRSSSIVCLTLFALLATSAGCGDDEQSFEAWLVNAQADGKGDELGGERLSLRSLLRPGLELSDQLETGQVAGFFVIAESDRPTAVQARSIDGSQVQMVAYGPYDLFRGWPAEPVSELASQQIELPAQTGLFRVLVADAGLGASQFALRSTGNDDIAGQDTYKLSVSGSTFVPLSAESEGQARTSEQLLESCAQWIARTALAGDTLQTAQRHISDYSCSWVDEGEDFAEAQYTLTLELATIEGGSAIPEPIKDAEALAAIAPDTASALQLWQDRCYERLLDLQSMAPMSLVGFSCGAPLRTGVENSPEIRISSRPLHWQIP